MKCNWHEQKIVRGVIYRVENLDEFGDNKYFFVLTAFSYTFARYHVGIDTIEVTSMTPLDAHYIR